MSTQLFVPGPTQVFAGVGSSGAYQFLGYSQNGVDNQLVASYQDIISDPTGPMVPIDVQFMGEQFFGAATLNKYDESVLQTIAKRRVGSAVTAGAIEANGMGSLMLSQGYAWPLLLLFPYRALSFQTGAIVPCYAFGAAWLHDSFDVNLSVSVKAPRVILRAIPIANTTTLTSQLYTNTVPSPAPSPD